MAPRIPSTLEQAWRLKHAEEETELQSRNRFDEPAEAQQFYVLMRAPEGETSLPIERYFAARDAVRTMPVFSTLLARFLSPSGRLPEASASNEAGVLNSWTALGPGNIGGRTRALVLNPSNPNIMYAGGVAD